MYFYKTFIVLHFKLRFMIHVEFNFVYGMRFGLMLNFLPMEIQLFLALNLRGYFSYLEKYCFSYPEFSALVCKPLQLLNEIFYWDTWPALSVEHVTLDPEFEPHAGCSDYSKIKSLKIFFFTLKNNV